MVLTSLDTGALMGMCSKDQLDLLDSVDRLRSLGIDHYVSLPQIIVCGDQSSGKSSVLEAISGVSFPVKSNLCTRFPTELVLRQADLEKINVSIVPHNSRAKAERESLADFKEALNADFGGLPDLVEKAKVAMGITKNGKAFSSDLLRVEISGPKHPHLTIVDLPGLIHSETKDQSAADVSLIQGLVNSYMKEKRCVILAVVSAKNDYANQIVLTLARKFDPDGKRTLGVITKPDTLIPSSPSEKTYIALAQNQDINFRLGWHVLKNMDSDKGETTLVDRDAKELEFFSQGAWQNLPRSLLGIEKLRNRLSKVLLGQIAEELPSLVNEIETKAESCQILLDNLGSPRTSSDEQREYLFHVSQRFQMLAKAAIDGTYNDSFFGDGKKQEGYQKRFRAVLQNLNSKFAQELTQRGHYVEITEGVLDDTPSIPHSIVESEKDEAEEGENTQYKSFISQETYLSRVNDLMKRTQGRELPGTYNPMIVADLFYEQSQPWGAIVKAHINEAWRAASLFIRHVVTHVADESTAEALIREVLDPAMNNILSKLNEKMTELLDSHRQKCHPITYNHDFIQTLQQIRSKRMKKEFNRVLAKFFGYNGVNLDSVYCKEKNYNLENLATSLVLSIVQETTNRTALEAMDCMTAYYEVSFFSFLSRPRA